MPGVPAADESPTFPRLTQTAQFVLCACAVIATAAWLGTAWVREPILGLPAGMWLILAGALAVRTSERRETPGRRTPIEHLGRAALAGAIDLASRAFERLPAALGVPSRITAAAECRLCRWVDARRREPRPVRIGVSLPAHLVEALEPGRSAHGAEWVRLPAGRPAVDAAETGLDAIVSLDGSGRVAICTPESPQREAAWFDWGLPRPLAYASVFPTRLDVARVTFDAPDWRDPRQLDVLRALAETAGALARTSARLSLRDRVRGRRPLDPPQPALGRLAPPDAALLRLCRSARLVLEAGAHPSPMLVAAARAGGAWLATAPGRVGPRERRELAEILARACPAEPEAHLRLAAVRFADGDDASSHEALEAAQRLMSRCPMHPLGDHVAFLQAEIELGEASPLTLGRVAAGVCLVCAATPPDALAYVRDDILDDLRYTGWLVGRDHDRAAVIDVFRVVERFRRELPAAA
jgi:hypothetical protein